MADEETQAANDALRAQVHEARGEKPADTKTESLAKDASDEYWTDDEQDEELGPEGEKALAAFKQRAREAEKQAKSLAAKVREFEDRDKSDQQRLEERATNAEDRAAMAEAKVLRLEIALDKNLPWALAQRLQGSDKEQLEKDAEQLLELVKPNGKPSGDVDAGRGEGGGGATLNDLIRAGASR